MKLIAEVSYELMSTVGLSEVASQYLMHPYFGKDLVWGGPKTLPETSLLGEQSPGDDCRS